MERSSNWLKATEPESCISQPAQFCSYWNVCDFVLCVLLPVKPVTTNVSENSKLVLAIHMFVSKAKANHNVEYSFRRNLKLVD